MPTLKNRELYRLPVPTIDWAFLIGCGLTIMAVLGGLVYAFQWYGGDFVDGLDEQIGELTAIRARSSLTAGMSEEASRLFEEALAIPFLDEGQRLFCIHDFSTLLIDEEKYDQALEWIEEGARSHSNDQKLAYLRFRALKESGRNEETLAAVVLWYAVGERTDNVDAMRAAKFAEAVEYRDSRRPEQALNAFLAAHELRPGADTALRAATLCIQLGETDRARALLTEAARMPGGNSQAVQELLEQVTE